MSQLVPNPLCFFCISLSRLLLPAVERVLTPHRRHVQYFKLATMPFLCLGLGLHHPRGVGSEVITGGGKNGPVDIRQTQEAVPVPLTARVTLDKGTGFSAPPCPRMEGLCVDEMKDNRESVCQRLVHGRCLISVSIVALPTPQPTH